MTTVRFPDYSRLIDSGNNIQTTTIYTATEDCWGSFIMHSDTSYIELLVNGAKIGTGTVNGTGVNAFVMPFFFPLKKGDVVTVSRAGTSTRFMEYYIYGIL